jgi:hypothetical protein
MKMDEGTFSGPLAELIATAQGLAVMLGDRLMGSERNKLEDIIQRVLKEREVLNFSVDLETRITQKERRQINRDLEWILFNDDPDFRTYIMRVEGGRLYMVERGSPYRESTPTIAMTFVESETKGD